MDPVVQWLLEVDRQLAPEGFQLLKALYLDTLRSKRRALSDGVQSPHELHSLLCDDWNGGDNEQTTAAPDGNHVQESSRMSPEYSLALFIHRLSVLLVPSSAQPDAQRAAREFKNKSLGAEECLASRDRLGITCPPVTFAFSQDSNALECLVKCYVSLTQQRRYELKLELARKAKMHGDNASIFDILAELFARQGHREGCSKAIAGFASSMEQAKAPISSYVELEQNLTQSSVPHEKIIIPGIINSSCLLWLAMSSCIKLDTMAFKTVHSSALSKHCGSNLF